MPCRVLKALKSCASRVCASSSSSERTTSHRNLVQTQTEEVAGSTCGCFALREKAVKYREGDNLDDLEDQVSTLPASVGQSSIMIRKQDSFFDSQIQLPRRPPSIDKPLQTEDQFVNALSEAQKYKDACAAAEDAAEEEARRRFKYYQDIYYLEKEIQDRVVDAHRKLQRLRRSALEAGFSHLVPKSTIVPGFNEENRNTSQDTINRLIHRLDDTELDLLYAARAEKDDNGNRGGSPLREEI